MHRTNILTVASMFVLFGITATSVQAQQGDSTKVRMLDEVNIGGWFFKTETSPAAVQTLTTMQLRELPTLQLSDAIKYLSGVVVKDYGGTGGMKTVSVRGLGSQHTGVAYDNIALTDCQTGQIDLGKISMDCIGSVKLITGLDNDIMKPARLYSYSNLLDIKTYHMMPERPVSFRIALTEGAYGLVSPQFYFEHLLRNKKREDRYLLWNISGNYTHADGNYPYLLHYGQETDSVSKERRQNSEMRAFNAEANIHIAISRRQFLSIKGYCYDSKRGLPSATVLYNLESSQKLWNRNIFGQAQYTNAFAEHWQYHAGIKYNYDYTKYLDPEYLNDAGFLDNRYRQYEGYLTQTIGYDADRKGKTNFAIALSNDLFYNQLKANILNYEDPLRFTTLTALTGKISSQKFTIAANILLTTVNNRAQGETLGKNYIHLSPSVSASLQTGSLFFIRAFYKNIFRMPTFNDLYYREVGNLELEPEKTHQWNLGLVLKQQRFAGGKITMSASYDNYFNIVKDKIVAFPARNLFSWTMLNYGKVWIAGAELNMNLECQFYRGYYFRFNGNVTYQKAVDRTEEGSKTYNHQIPYTPKWSGTSSVCFQTPWFNVGYHIILCGKRYSLRENLPENIVNGYIDHSITIGHEIEILKSKSGIQGTKIDIKLELLNLSNLNYEIIKNYPMQGFGWRLKIGYSF